MLHPIASRVNVVLDGWSPGAPPHITEATLAIDKRVVARLRCRCGGRMEFRPFHSGSRYRVLAVCTCGHMEER